MAVEQWGFFQPHLLCHLDFRGFLTLTSNSERLAVELSLPVWKDLDLSRLGFKHTTFRFQGECSSQLRDCRGRYKRRQKSTLSVNHSHFHFLRYTYLATFKQTWHIVFLIEWISVFLKIWTFFRCEVVIIFRQTKKRREIKFTSCAQKYFQVECPYLSKYT